MSELPCERVRSALEHREPDRVPVDLAGTLTTGINRNAYRSLCEELGVPFKDDLVQRSQMLARVDPAILDRFQVDFEPLLLRPPDGWQDRELGDGTWENEWGIVYAPTPGGAHYPKVHPLAEVDRAGLARYRWPDPRDPGRVRGLRRTAMEMREATGRAIVGELSAFLLQQAQNLRGFDRFLEDLVVDAAFAEDLLDRLLEYYAALAESLLGVAGDLVAVVTMGDDLGLQQGLMISPELYRRFIKPRQRKLIEAIRRRTDAKLFFHTCGSVIELLPDLVEIGVDILNPIQVSARGMDDTRSIKREFGRDLAFWGGIDTQHVLPFADIGGVRDEVRRRIDDLAPGGGFILAPVHNIQAEVPGRNTRAMYEAALQWGIGGSRADAGR